MPFEVVDQIDPRENLRILDALLRAEVNPVSLDPLPLLATDRDDVHGRARGEPDEDWPAWYAAFIVARWSEEPDGGTHELHLDDEEHRLLEAAVHSYLDDFGHDQADLLRQLKDLHAKVQSA